MKAAQCTAFRFGSTPRPPKNSRPEHRDYGMDETPVVVVDDATIKVMIGSLEGCTSPVFTFSPAFYFHVNYRRRRLDPPVAPTTTPSYT